MDSLELEEIDEIINQLSSPESGYESPERLSEIREFYISYGNQIGCHLQIVEQPQSFYRFRYITEFKDNPHGPLTGEKSTKLNKTFPTVKLVNYPRKAIIRCWLCVSTNKDVHIHQLLTKNDGRGIRSEPHDVIIDTKNNFTAVFEGLNIIHAVTKGKKEYLDCLHKKKCHIRSGYKMDPRIIPYDEKALKNEVKSMEKNKAILYFEAFDFENHKKLCETFSCQIKNSKSPETNPLKISRQSHKNGLVNGDTEVLIFVEKVTKDIKVRFFELDETEEVCWEEYAAVEDLWHQVAIAFRTPRYKDINIQEDRKVYFQLIRESDNSFSNEMEFHYQPDYRNLPNYIEPVIGKKRRMKAENTYVLHSLDPTEFNSDLESNQLSMENNILKVFQDVYMNFPQEDDEQSLSGILRDSFVISSANFSEENRLLEVDPQQFEDVALSSFLASDCVIGELKSESKILANSQSHEDSVENFLRGKPVQYHSATSDCRFNENKVLDQYTIARDLFRCLSEHCSPDFFKETLKNLKQKKLNLQNFKNTYNKTPLHMAIEQGKLEFVKPLLNAGFNINDADIDHNSALHLALIYNADPSIITLLVSSGADLTLINYDGEMPIHLGCRLRRHLHLYLLVNEDVINYKSKKTGDTPLHIAAKYGYQDVAELLLKSGAVVYTQNYGNYTSLDYAIQNEHEDIVNLLLKHMNPLDRRNIFLVDIIRTKVQSENMYGLLEDYLRKNGECNDTIDSSGTDLCDTLSEKCSLKQLTVNSAII